AANAENRDAFFHIENGLTVNGPTEKEITLKRPFAQLNFVTSDYEAAKASGIEATTTSVKVKNLKPTLSLVDGKATGNAAEVTFTTAARPNETMTINGNTYDYLAMNYLLIDDTRDVVECEMTAYDAADANDTRVLTVSSVPVQRNYRTNIYGALLTSTTNFNVTINPAFDGVNNYEVWDGRSVETPAVVNNVVTITKPSQWAALRNVAGIDNYTVELAADLDFGNQILKGQICPKEFNGNGYTMKNMILAPGGSDYSIGLFQGDASASIDKTIKNVTIENVKIDCTDPNQGYAGVLFGDVQVHDLTIDGVTVKNADVKGVCADGALVGFVASGKNISINNCTVANSRIYNYAVDKESGFVGGLVGRVVGSADGGNNTLDNVVVDGFYAARRGSASIDAVAGITGTSTLTATQTNVTVNKKCLIGPACANDHIIAALTENIETLNVYLANDVTVALASTTFRYGGDNTTVVSFNGNGHKLTIDSSYRQWLKAKNDNAKFVLNDLALNGTFETERTWDGYDIIFCNEVEANNVTFSRAVAVDKVKGTFNNCVINQLLNQDAYALWVVAGSDVTVKDCAINSKTGNGGRAIKVADEYACDSHGGGGTPANTTLAVEGTTFKSDKKAAILVSSCSDTNITWGAGNDISAVAADSTNPVWKDNNATFTGTVTATGCTPITEP
ncbi:MAG: hypothetical protein PUD91_02060, partial [Bacteroidales bacterium]|nr:hypothetical protein [Bacteroidales bacterium]